jgi:hypothetical protein
LVTRELHDLRPHPSYIKHCLSVSASRLAALAELGDLAFVQPILVSRKGIIVDGYARWELARRQGRATILCLEYDWSDEEALRWLVQSHSPSKGFTSFSRCLLALDLEPSFQERARVNQQIGGQGKSSSHLTEAQKLDVRSEIAAVASVSTGSLTKAKRVVVDAHPTIRNAAKSGEIRVHRAYQWSLLSHHHQLKKLEEFRSCKGVGLVSRRLIQKHVARMAPAKLIPPTLGHVLRLLIPDRIGVLDEISVSEIDAPGRIAYFSKDAIGVLELRGTLNAAP